MGSIFIYGPLFEAQTSRPRQLRADSFGHVGPDSKTLGEGKAIAAKNPPTAARRRRKQRRRQRRSAAPAAGGKE